MKLGTGSGLVQRPSVNRGEEAGQRRVRDSGGDENSSHDFGNCCAHLSSVLEQICGSNCVGREEPWRWPARIREGAAGVKKIKETKHGFLEAREDRVWGFCFWVVFTMAKALVVSVSVFKSR